MYYQIKNYENIVSYILSYIIMYKKVKKCRIKKEGIELIVKNINSMTKNCDKNTK
ncbi:hypothetical protein CBB2_3172 [Clostridium botulinum]|nr:hypothetical protein CBN_0510 [Clostridium botulinum NCTC 2916]BAQ36175.1 hypothetical protein CBB2_3172 [Clostridium botulinum]